MLDIFWSADDINVGTVNRRPVDVAVLFELLAQPNQQVLAAAVLLARSWRCSPGFARHLMRYRFASESRRCRRFTIWGDLHRVLGNPHRSLGSSSPPPRRK